MPNPIAKTIPALLTSAGDARNAAYNHGNSIRLLQITGPVLQASIEELRAAAYAFETAKAELSRRRAVVRDIVQTSRGFLTLARDNFKPILGPEYNEGWDMTGLVGSLVIPGSPLDVQPLLHSFKAYLQFRPAEAVPSKEITPEKFEELFTALDDARTALRQQELVVDRTREVREEKFRLLRKRMRGLIAELDLLLEPTDPMWKVFGFNPPGASETPEAPENVVATVVAPGKVDVKWEPAPNTDYYRVWKRVIGTDPELVVVATAADLDFMMDEVPSGVTIELAVSAINESGESRLSELVTVKT